jgi:hypothetical protein
LETYFSWFFNGVNLQYLPVLYNRHIDLAEKMPN